MSKRKAELILGSEMWVTDGPQKQHTNTQSYVHIHMYVLKGSNILEKNTAIS